MSRSPGPLFALGILVATDRVLMLRQDPALEQFTRIVQQSSCAGLEMKQDELVFEDTEKAKPKPRP